MNATQKTLTHIRTIGFIAWVRSACSATPSFALYWYGSMLVSLVLVTAIVGVSWLVLPQLHRDATDTDSSPRSTFTLEEVQKAAGQYASREQVFEKLTRSAPVVVDPGR